MNSNLRGSRLFSARICSHSGRMTGLYSGPTGMKVPFLPKEAISGSHSRSDAATYSC